MDFENQPLNSGWALNIWITFGPVKIWFAQYVPELVFLSGHPKIEYFPESLL